MFLNRVAWSRISTTAFGNSVEDVFLDQPMNVGYIKRLLGITNVIVYGGNLT